MKKYITSDKVGEFVQTLHEHGFKYVSVEPEHVAVRHDDGSYTFIKIFPKGSYDDLVQSVINTEIHILKQTQLDAERPVNGEEA
jgi:predicted RNA binding protein YcfA (HicA-like mRNA interferase family)